MPKKFIALGELEKIVLQMLKETPQCAEALAVTIEVTEENPQAGNWRVASFDSGEAARDNCEEALWAIEDQLLPVYDVAA
jgi:hypothetical protein